MSAAPNTILFLVPKVTVWHEPFTQTPHAYPKACLSLSPHTWIGMASYMPDSLWRCETKLLEGLGKAHGNGLCIQSEEMKELALTDWSHISLIEVCSPSVHVVMHLPAATLKLGLQGGTLKATQTLLPSSWQRNKREVAILLFHPTLFLNSWEVCHSTEGKKSLV